MRCKAFRTYCSVQTQQASSLLWNHDFCLVSWWLQVWARSQVYFETECFLVEGV